MQEQHTIITTNQQTVRRLLECGWAIIGQDYRGFILQP